jgi:hypothetical protein
MELSGSSTVPCSTGPASIAAAGACFGWIREVRRPPAGYRASGHCPSLSVIEASESQANDWVPDYSSMTPCQSLTAIKEAYRYETRAVH